MTEKSNYTFLMSKKQEKNDYYKLLVYFQKSFRRGASLDMSLFVYRLYVRFYNFIIPRTASMDLSIVMIHHTWKKIQLLPSSVLTKLQ